jgi:hypothetical protein
MGIRDLARSLGYDSEYIDLSFVLELPVAEAKRCELERWVREGSGSYEAVTWVGLPPAEWREAYCLMHNLDDLDLPPEHRELSPWTADQVERLLRSEICRGGDLITTLVVDAGGAPAAMSNLFVSGPPHGWAFEAVTTVLIAHRGHRLSALAKVANLQRLGQDFPRTRAWHTEVAVDDEAMWAVNERFGFRVTTEPARGSRASPSGL